MKDNKSQLHYLYNLIYPVAILIAVIIVLLTVKWGDIPEFVKYVTFGLTLTSLMLSLLAIIYMIVSQVSYSRGINVLGDASNAVSGATDRLTDVTAGLASKIESIPPMIEEVRKRVDKKHQELLQELGAGKSKGEVAILEGISFTKEGVSSFLNGTSFTGAGALYVCQLAYSKKVPFDSNKAWESSKDYFHGFLVACAACGLLAFNIKDSMWNVTEFNENYLKDMRTICIEKAKWLGKTNPKWPDFESSLIKQIENVEEYFKD